MRFPLEPARAWGEKPAEMQASWRRRGKKVNLTRTAMLHPEELS
jgi:hypothetical protein